MIYFNIQPPNPTGNIIIDAFLREVYNSLNTIRNKLIAWPSGVTDNEIPRFDGTEAFQGSGVLIDDSRSLSGVAGLSLGIRRISATGSILESDYTVELDASTGNVTATLFSASLAMSGKLIKVTAVNVDNNAILSTPDTLPDGSTSFQFLKVGETLDLQVNSTGTGWV